jgi:iron complex transport system substrate-binding protein
MRIVSLLPSATEIICALGLRNQLVGVTHECDFPASVVGLPRVTSTMIPHDATSGEIDALVRQRANGRLPLYQLDAEKLSALRPDLIVTQALCDVCAVDEEEVQHAASEMSWRPRVINLQPTSLTSVFDGMREVADAARVSDYGTTVIAQLNTRVELIQNRSEKISERPSVVFFEWIDPLFCSGHWNPELIEIAGAIELIGRSGEKSRRIEFEELRNADPDVIFIACCGFSVERTRADVLRVLPQWQQFKAVRHDRIYIADGSAYFNRPGPRLVDSLEILAHALHPTVHPLPAGAEPALRLKCESNSPV